MFNPDAWSAAIIDVVWSVMYARIVYDLLQLAIGFLVLITIFGSVALAFWWLSRQPNNSFKIRTRMTEWRVRALPRTGWWVVDQRPAGQYSWSTWGDPYQTQEEAQQVVTRMLDQERVNHDRRIKNR